MINSALKHLCVLIAVFALAQFAHAQNIRVYGGNQVAVEDGSTNAMALNETDFGSVNNASEKIHEFWIFNMDESVPVQITAPVQVGGDNPGDFQIFQPYTNINYGAYVPLQVTFNPLALGTRSAIITISNNTPGSKEQYTFLIKGESIAGFPVATADISLSGLGTDVKLKANKKTGIITAQWKIGIANVSTLPAEGALVTFYHTTSEVLSFNEATLLTQVSVKALKPAPAGKSPKYKSIKMKTAIPDTGSGRIFAVATLLPLFPQETYQDYNAIEDSY